MPNQVVPIQDIAKAGIIMDTPSVSLPPNVFSDALNVRFDDNAIRKMEGENATLINIGPSSIRYVAWWPHPDLAPADGYYVYVYRDDTVTPAQDRVALVQATEITSTYSPTNLWRNEFDSNGGDDYVIVRDNTQWQHTLFGGGRTLILNNGTTTPRYITDPTSTQMYELPGWDSYLVDETITTFSWDFNNVPVDGDTPLGVDVDLTTRYTADDTIPMGSAIGDVMSQGTQRVIVTIVPADTRISQYSVVLDEFPFTERGVTIGFNDETDSHFLTFNMRTINADGTVDPLNEGINNGDTLNIQIQTIPEILVRARVIKTFGNLLIAGNLTETMRMGGAPVRNMPGLIRTSDVAAAGNIPANWNPFHIGVNTADEFTLSSTGIVQDMAELQGVMFVYTNNSIHSIQATGNSNLPYNVRPVAEGYGAQTMGAVQEFDGKHVVIGSNDIYVFSGHPGSIQSISDGRVRKEFYRRLDPDNEQRLFTLLNRRQDELWINYPTNGELCDETLIWNYRDNTWTRRIMTPFYHGDIAPLHNNSTGALASLDPNMRIPVLAYANDAGTINGILQVDIEGAYTMIGGTYNSYVERQRLAITPEFDTETLASVALLVSNTTALTLDMIGTNRPVLEYDFDTGVDHETFTFTAADNYKVDTRIQGRFLNYRISNEAEWELSGMQYEIRKGGQR